MIIISCDPGKTGAVVVLEDGHLVKKVPVPLFKDKTIDSHSLWTSINLILMTACTDVREVKCCIEFVHAMPAQGVSSSFAFGKTTGMLEAVLTWFDDDHKIDPVRSQAWKKHFNLIKTTKEDAVALALEMCPKLFDGFDKTPNKQIQSGIADAYLIGKYYEFTLSHE